MTTAPPPPRPGPLVMLLLLALVAALAGLRLRPPSPAPLDAPATALSARRVAATLARLAGDQAPHGVGTAQASAVRERIEYELQRMGLTVERQPSFACRGISCAALTNLVAEVPGTHAGAPVVLLTSHYDSVHAGPGIADDLHAVAIGLEVARALLAGEPPLHPVRLLFDEGEEVGLLGAQAFVDHHPRASEVGVVINAEARGTTGLSSLFETSPGNASLVEPVLPVLTRPQATSLAVEVYRRMPNDTDLSVFHQAGYPGINFAFVGGVARYHTPLDDLAHLDLGSVQHQGDNVLAATRALANAPLPRPASDDAIYADVLGLAVLRWPAAWALPIAILPLLAVVGLVLLARRAGRLRLRGLGGGALLVPLALAVTIAVGWPWVAMVAALHGETLAAHANPGPLRLSLWLLAVVIAWGLGALVARRSRPLERALGGQLVWALAAVLLASEVPGASPALVLPVGMAVLGLAVATLWPRHESTGLLLAAIPMIAIWTTLALGLEDVFGFALAPAVVAPIAVATTAIIPGLSWPDHAARRLLAATGALLLVATIVASVVPVYDADHPRRIALVRYDDRAHGEARLVAMGADGVSEPLRAALGSPEVGPVIPWTNVAGTWAPVEPSRDPAPKLEVERTAATGSGRTIEARLTSPRGADRAVLLLPAPRLAAVRVEGQPAATADDARGRLLLFGVPAHGVSVDLTVRDADPLEVTVVDCVAGLPQSASSVVAARDVDGVPVQWGDMTCVATEVRL